MKTSIVTVFVILFSLIPIAYGIPHESELVLDDIWIDISLSKEDELLAINASVYNNGIKNPASFASIVTVAYFVDGELLHLGELGDVKPGLSNKIHISSPPVWKTSSGEHTVKVVVDFHNSLNDEIDYPDDNTLEKIFSIVPNSRTQVSIDAVPQYFVAETKTPKIKISLLDLNSGNLLTHQKITLYLNDDFSTLFTNEHGVISFIPDVPFSNPIEIRAYFEGDDQYLSSDASLTVFPFEKTNSSILILSISDLSDSSLLLDDSLNLHVFQDSDKTIFHEVSPTTENMLDSRTVWIAVPPNHNYYVETENMLDSRTVWIAVPPNHNYYVETHLNGKLSDVSETKFVTVNDVTLMENLSTVQEKSPSTVIPAWIKNNAGWWSDGQIDDSSFLLGIQHLINQNIILVPNMDRSDSVSSQPAVIPAWIKNNAGWWSDGQIDDSSFVQGIQFLIQEGYLKISN